MDKDKIIKSNLLEKYALGISSQMEEDMVHQALSLFPELREELDKIEQSLEQTAFENKIEAPEGVKERVLEQIEKIKKSDSAKSEVAHPTNKAIKINWWTIAASFLAGAFLSGLWAWNNIATYQKEIVSYQSEISLLQEECESDKIFFAFTNDINTQKVILQDSKDGFAALGYWNESQEKGILQLINLPVIQDDEAYQIWADVEGEMIAVGLLENEDYAANNYIDLNYLTDAESINITIEPEGGSDHPDVDRLILSASI